MNNVKRLIVDHPKTVIIVFLVLTLVSGLLIPTIKINQDNASYRRTEQLKRARINCLRSLG